MVNARCNNGVFSLPLEVMIPIVTSWLEMWGVCFSLCILPMTKEWRKYPFQIFLNVCRLFINNFLPQIWHTDFCHFMTGSGLPLLEQVCIYWFCMVISVVLKGTYQSQMFACFRDLPRALHWDSFAKATDITDLELPLINTLTAVVQIYDNSAR